MAPRQKKRNATHVSPEKEVSSSEKISAKKSSASSKSKQNTSIQSDDQSLNNSSSATQKHDNWGQFKGNLQKNLPITKGLRKRLGKNVGQHLRQNITKRIVTPLTARGDKPFPLTSMLPNIVTLLGLCAGLSALRFALMEQWAFAVFAILIAALLDTMDGALARMLNASSHFGAELDSLSDFASFGITPALIMYFVSLNSFGAMGWLFVLWFCVCGALRLARFNTRANPSWAKAFFTGTPITSSALLCLTPLVMHLGWPEQTITLHPWFVGPWMAGVGFCMISRIPTFSVKKIEIPAKFLLPLVIVLVVTVTAIISHPWRTLSVIMILYIATFPLSFRAYKKIEAKCIEE